MPSEVRTSVRCRQALSIEAFYMLQRRLAESFSAIFDKDSGVGREALKLERILDQLDAHQKFEEAYRATVLEPAVHYAVLFPDVADHIKKRNNKLLDYDAARSQVKRLVDSPASDVSKLPKAEAEAAQAREAYESINSRLIKGIPRLIELRGDYLGPSFDALMALQLKLSDDMSGHFEAIRVASVGLASSEQALREIRNLPVLSL